MGDPADISDISDVTGVETDMRKEIMTMVENTARELTSPFIAGVFQGFLSVAKQYRQEKKDAAKLAKEQQEKELLRQTTDAIAPELNEGSVWIGVGASELSE